MLGNIIIRKPTLLEGVFMAKGPHIRPRYEVHANIIDLASAIFHVLEKVIPSNLDGGVLNQKFEEAFLKTRPKVDEASWKKMSFDSNEAISLVKREEIPIRGRLESLGCIH